MASRRGMPPQGGTYAVGYGRPPEHTRFKPGQSGNKHGRPKGRPNLRTVFDDALNAKVIVNEGGRRRTVTRMQAIALQTINNAMKGDPRALTAILQMVKAAGMNEDEQKEVLPEDLNTADRAILEDYHSRHRLAPLGETTAPATPDDPEPAGDE